MKKRVVNATDLKGKCSVLLDEIEKHGEPITILRRGRPVAVLGPAKKTAWRSLKDVWAGKIEIVGDIVNADPDLWECVREE
jgi:prevent-host-death family protein